MGLRRYVIKRLAYSFLLLIFAMSLNFVIFMVMPGDPARMFVDRYRPNDPSIVENATKALYEMWGLNDSSLVRYAKYVKNMLTWNFGITFDTRKPVANEIMWRMPYTLTLMGGSTALAIILGVLLGALAANKRGSKFDSASVVSSLVFYSLPTFWVGLMFILIFYTNLHWLPIAGAFPREWALNPTQPISITSPFPSPFGMFVTVNPHDLWSFLMGFASHACLPILTLTLFQYGGYLLLTRATMVDALTEDYVVTAKAKGVSQRNIVLKHALKNASLPIITSAAMSLGFMLSGAIITETVYSWPGLGTWIFQAINAKDYNVLQAVFFIIAACVIASNFAADLLYGIIDPRIKY